MASRSATPQQILTHLERILASREFASAPRLSGFLRFVVETTLQGKAEEIKESLIAMEVYGRPADYNPQIDSTVRVEAGRLRTRLHKWYESEGRNEEVRIEMPKGRYVATFHRVHESRKSHATVAAALFLGIFAAVFAWSQIDVGAPDDAETMEIYHRAQDLLRIPVLKDGPTERVPDTVLEAVQLFRAVTRRTPSFAKGWTGLAEAAEWEYELRGNQPPERLAEAKAAALQAVQLDAADAEAWTVLTSISFFREWEPERRGASVKACGATPTPERQGPTAIYRYSSRARAARRGEGRARTLDCGSAHRRSAPGAPRDDAL